MLLNVLKSLVGARRSQSAGIDRARIQRLLEEGGLQEAGRLVEDGLKISPHDAELWAAGGTIAGHCRDFETMRVAYLKAVEYAPDNLAYRGRAADAYRLLGDTATATRIAHEILAINNGHYMARHLLACMEMPGPVYTDVLKYLHTRLSPATYLEIGVDTGAAIALACAATHAIGVDPAPKIKVALGANVRIIAKTSDDFFVTHDVCAEFAGKPIEFAFIDGMHQCDFALRDFTAIERCCKPGAVILVHDCYPLDRDSASREQHTEFWSGDVWKTILALKKYRPDLDIKTIGAAPTGLALVRNLDPASRVLHERMDEIVADMEAMDYTLLDRDKRAALNWYPNEWSRIDELIAPSH